MSEKVRGHSETLSEHWFSYHKIMKKLKEKNVSVSKSTVYLLILNEDSQQKYKSQNGLISKWKISKITEKKYLIRKIEK